MEYVPDRGTVCGGKIIVPVSRVLSKMMKLRTAALLWVSISSNDVDAFTSSLLSSPPVRQRILRLSGSKSGELWKVERIDNISDWTKSSKVYQSPLSKRDNIPSSWFVGLDDAVAAKVQINAHEEDSPHDRGLSGEAFILAGPRADIAFDPKECKSAIVTCGGLCPGLNSVIREVVMCLRRQYGVSQTVSDMNYILMW